MKCALTLGDNKRVLVACVVLPNGNYDGMPIVEELPEGNLPDYLYINGEYIYDPLPEPDQPEPALTPEERIVELEAKNKTLTAQVDALSGQIDFQEECIVEMAGIIYA